MVAIYEKALKRNDYSGIVDKQKQEEEQDDKTLSKLDHPLDFYLLVDLTLAV